MTINQDLGLMQVMQFSTILNNKTQLYAKSCHDEKNKQIWLCNQGILQGNMQRRMRNNLESFWYLMNTRFSKRVEEEIR